MRVPDDILKCVAFIGRRDYKDGREFFRFLGTGFLISVPSEKQQDAHFIYFVTARHVVVDGISGLQFAVRINTTDNQTRYVWSVPEDYSGPEKSTVKWWFHPTEEESVDVAITPWIYDIEEDIKTVHVERFLSEEMINEQGIGPGDEVFFPGCFTLLSGEQRNYPLVRTGNIAMMPGEPIPNVKTSSSWIGEIKGYLIEARSIGGLSGSPVFVRETVTDTALVEYAKTKRRVNKNVTFLGEDYLLGLAQGHWEVSPEDKNSVLIIPDKSPHRVNLGISIVVPASKILEVINHPELVEMRKRDDERAIREKGTSQPDSAVEDEGSSFTRQDFEKALKKVSRKLPEQPSESGQENA